MSPADRAMVQRGDSDVAETPTPSAPNSWRLPSGSTIYSVLNALDDAIRTKRERAVRAQRDPRAALRQLMEEPPGAQPFGCVLVHRNGTWRQVSAGGRLHG